MILVVNVGKSLRAGVPVIVAAERAWALSLTRCSTCQYLVAVSQGAIEGYFVIVDTHPDHIDSSRVAFKLGPCEPSQIAYINGQIGGTPLGGIQRGKYIP